jgi:two-component system phosphate regulon sensor histidine kinase PhoR
MSSLLASIVFTLALIGLFIYFLYMVYRQKKVAQIKDDFINNLTHEFKTPIFSIGLAAGLLKRNEFINTQQHLNKYVTLIETEKTRLENHVNKILQMAMIDSGNFVLDKKQLDVHALIESVVSDFALALDGKGGHVDLQLNASNATIKGDEVHLKNVIFNLLDNALKYTNLPPVIKIETEYISKKEGNKIAIAISDNGIGMDEEVQKNIFSKFYRGHSGDVHDVKGFGLGMSYIKSIVEAHKGSITVESAPGKGTSFHLTLPAN